MTHTVISIYNQIYKLSLFIINGFKVKQNWTVVYTWLYLWFSEREMKKSVVILYATSVNKTVMLQIYYISFLWAGVKLTVGTLHFITVPCKINKELLRVIIYKNPMAGQILRTEFHDF